MTFEEKKILLKNGKTAILRSPYVRDAERMLSNIKQACGETEFLSRYPEEWNISVEQEAAWIDKNLASPNDLVIVCAIDGVVVGSCDIMFKTGLKNSHRATVGISILKDYWDLGLGSAMFQELISAAQKRGTEIVELELIKGNDRAQRLYEKFGFRVVAEKPNAFKTKDGGYQTDLYMQKYL